MNKNALWFVGQIAAISIGISIGINHGAPIGVFASSVLFVLIDIRRELQK